MSVACVFCEIVRGAEPASIVWEDELTMAFLDRRQFHPGHTLVIPRQHLCDVRELDRKTGAALMDSIARITVPHLHIHVHPRMLNDRLLRIYPSAAAEPDKRLRDEYAATLRSHLG